MSAGRDAVIALVGLGVGIFALTRKASAGTPEPTGEPPPPEDPGQRPGDVVTPPSSRVPRGPSGVGPTPWEWQDYVGRTPTLGKFYQVTAADLPGGLLGIAKRALGIASDGIATGYLPCIQSSDWNRIYGDDASLAFSRVNEDALAALRGGRLPEVAHEATNRPTVTEAPTPGAWYDIRRGDNLLSVAGRAYNVTAGADRMQGARAINDARANAPYRQAGLDANLFGPAGRITFLPVFSCDLTERLRGIRGGNCYATIWIPPGTGGEPAETPGIQPAGTSLGLLWLPPATIDGTTITCPDPALWEPDGETTANPPPDLLESLS